MVKKGEQVLWVAHWLPSDKKAGRGIFIIEQALAYQAAGGKPVFLSVQFAPGGIFKPEWRHYQEQGLPVLELCIKSFAHKLWQLWPALWLSFMLKKIKQKLQGHYGHIDAVHSQVILPAGIVGAQLARSLGCRHYLSEHWSKAPEFWAGKLYPFSRRSALKALRHTEKMNVVSAFSLQQLEAVLPAWAPPLSIIPNVVHRPLDLSAQSFPEGPQRKLKLLAVASWNQAKNITKRPDILIDCLKILAAQYPNQLELSIVGTGNMLRQMQEELKKLQLRFTCHGFVDKKSLSQLYQSHHLLVHASNIETFSLVVAEALAHGTPVVASEVGAIPELLKHPESGQLVSNRPEGFAQAIEAIWQRYPTDRLALAQHYQTLYSSAKIGPMIAQLYKN